jgi:hypothetical protein
VAHDVSAGCFGRKVIARIVSDAEQIKKIHPCLLKLLVYLQQKAGELVLPITCCSSVIILENTLN